MTIAKEKTSASFGYDWKLGAAHRLQRQIWPSVNRESMCTKPNPVMYGWPELSTMMFGYLGVSVAAMLALGDCALHQDLHELRYGNEGNRGHWRCQST